MSRGGNKFSSTTTTSVGVVAAEGSNVTLPFNTSHHLNASNSDDSADEVESQNLLPHLMPRMSGRQRLNPGLSRLTQCWSVKSIVKELVSFFM